jgi:hypothetical protein
MLGCLSVTLLASRGFPGQTVVTCFTTAMMVQKLSGRISSNKLPHAQRMMISMRSDG